MSKAEAVKGGIEAADSLYELAKKFAGDVVIPGKGLVVAIRNWTKYTFSLNYKVKRGMIMNTNGSTLHPYSQEYHGEHHEFLFKGKANSGCSVVMEINKSEQEQGKGTYYMRAAAARDGLNYVRFHLNDRKGLDKMKKHRSGDGFYQPSYGEYYFDIHITEDRPAICTVEIIPKGETVPRT